MNAIKTVQEAFELEGLDADQVKVTGIPERHVEAAIAIAKLFVVHDAVNAGFQPDYSNQNQHKYENHFIIGSPSGAGFSFGVRDRWLTFSCVGSRLVSGSSEAARHIAEHFPDLYKAFMVYERPTNELLNP